MAKVFRIALTGAPCSGKTSAIERLAADFYNESRDVFICTEAAYEVIAEGCSRDDYLVFETEVAKKQIQNEDELLKRAYNSEKQEAVIFYDRTVTDCFSYVDDRDALAKSIGMGIVDSWSRYDAIIMLEAVERSGYFCTSSRIENYETALDCQDKLLDVMVGHPHLRYVKSNDSFDKKYASVKAEIDSVLSGYEIEKKLLIEYPDFNKLAKYKPFKTKISQTYLLCAVGSHRVRKRSASGVDTYFETLKIRVTGSCCEETESIISKQRYDELLKSADPSKHTINKDRYCFLFDGQYFELDVFDFWNDRAFLELEMKSENHSFTLPPEIKVIKDVSNDYHYKNNYLAGLDL